MKDAGIWFVYRTGWSCTRHVMWQGNVEYASVFQRLVRFTRFSHAERLYYSRAMQCDYCYCKGTFTKTKNSKGVTIRVQFAVSIEFLRGSPFQSGVMSYFVGKVIALDLRVQHRGVERLQFIAVIAPPRHLGKLANSRGYYASGEGWVSCSGSGLNSAAGRRAEQS
jgi:hypothetical protein